MKREGTEILGIQLPESWMKLPDNIKVDYSPWDMFDELGSWWLQGAAVVGGGPYVGTPDLLTGDVVVTSPGAIRVWLPPGALLTITNGDSFTVPSGNQAIIVRGLTYPLETKNVQLEVVPVGAAVREAGQFCLFLGGRVGDRVFLRPDTVLS